MGAKTTIKLSNRSPKQPIKKLPASIEVDVDTRVEEIKVLIARAAGIKDFNRVGLFDPTTRKTLKNRKAAIGTEEAVMKAGELLVKDLGYQIDWTTVFVVEYAGPIVAHLIVLLLRPYIYPANLPPPLDFYAPSHGEYYALSQTQQLAFAMVLAHFLKREFETLFVHKFSANTMPWTNIFKNSAFYWALAGLVGAYNIYAPNSLAAKADDQPLVTLAGAVLFLYGEVSNAIVHLNLASLRTRGGTERQIPRGYGFGLVTCPNYMFEVLAWVGLIIASRSWALAIFIAVGTAQMSSWARAKERAYRKEFPDKYKKKRYVMLPGLI